MNQPKVEFLIEPGCPISDRLLSILRESESIIPAEAIQRRNLPKTDPRRKAESGRMYVNGVDVSGTSACPAHVKKAAAQAISKEDLQDRLARAMLLDWE